MCSPSLRSSRRPTISLLLLDEPTNSLDESGVELVKQIVREERDRGATVVLSCHDAAILEGLADEIISLEHGRIVPAQIEKRALKGMER